MAVTQYIGSRYVPLFAEPIEWSSQNTYEPLTIVIHEGNSYTSRQAVPKGIAIDNADFWALTGNYNAQVELYRRETAAAKAAADAAQETADGAQTAAGAAHDAADAAQDAADAAQGAADAAQGDIDVLLPKTAFSSSLTVQQYVDRAQAFVNPSVFGAVGDGVADDTQALQDAINSGLNVRLEANKTYLVSVQDVYALQLVPNIIIDLNGSTIKLQPNALDTYRIIFGANANGAVVRNGSIMGDYDQHGQGESTGEWCCGIYLQGCEGVTLENVIVTKCYGDGITIAGNSKRITVNGCTVSDNGRNGLAIVRCIGVKVSNCIFGEVSRVNPMACIDIEPNNATDIIDAVIIEGCTFENTQKAFMTYDHTGSVKNVIVIGCTFTGECHVRKSGFASSTPEHMSFVMRDSVIKCDTVPLNVLNVDSFASLTFDGVTIFSNGTHPIEVIGTDNRQSFNMLFDVTLNCPNATCIIHNNSTQAPQRCNVNYTLAQAVSSFADNNVAYATCKRQGVHYLRQANSNTETNVTVDMNIKGFESASTSVTKQIAITPQNMFDGYEFFLRQSGNGGQISFAQPSGYTFVGAESPVVLTYLKRAKFTIDNIAACIYVQE